jgi:hypothetical protein
MEPREHLWLQLPEVDLCQCELCGIRASNTAIASQVGVPTAYGWVVGEGSQYLPPCKDPEHDLDDDLALLNAGALPPAPEG